MKSKSLRILIALFMIVVATAAASAAHAQDSSHKADVPLDQVPQVVLDAAAKAVRGISLTEAKLRSKKSGVVFKLEGVAAGKQYELKVDARGKVLELDEEGNAANPNRNPNAHPRTAKRPDKVRAHRPDRPDRNRADNEKTYQDPAVAATSPARQTGTLAHPPIRESSGIIASRKYPGVFWTHNDKGNDPVLYAVTAEGKLLAEYPVDAPNDDWEDIAADDQGNLYIGNIGNNRGKRPHLEVYRLAEPNPTTTAAARPTTRPAAPLKVDQTWQLDYPDAPLNCESLLIHDGYAYVISKLFTGHPAGLYRFPLEARAPGDTTATPDNKTQVTLEKVANIPIKAPVTAADLSQGARTLAILSPAGLHLFPIEGQLPRAATTNPRTIPVPLGKLEGATFTQTGIVLTAEERQIYHIPQ